MSYTQADADNLRRAIATGARKVKFGSGDNAHETEFHSLDEMLRALARVDAEVAPASVPPRMSFIAHSRD